MHERRVVPLKVRLNRVARDTVARPQLLWHVDLLLTVRIAMPTLLLLLLLRLGLLKH